LQTITDNTGQINASLTSFSRTVDDYNKLAKQELVAEKQQKAYERIKNFRSEQADYRDRFDRLKKEAEERVRLACTILKLQSMSTAVFVRGVSSHLM